MTALPGLADLTLTPCGDRGLTAPGVRGPLSAPQIAALVDGAALGVRVLLADGARHRDLLAGVAHILGRDVFIAPAGADIRSVPASTGPEPVPVDRATCCRTDWLVLQPDVGQPLPTWFTLTAGMVRPRHGMVTIPLAGGLCLATADDFTVWRARAARLAPGHPGLVTIGAGTAAGDLLTGGYDGSVRHRTGEEFAAELATLTLYGRDVRLWLDWPGDPRHRQRLRANLERLARATGAVVWAPGPDARLRVADDCGDLTVSGGAWEAFRPGRAGPPRFESDRDGRLVPAGGFVVRRYRGVAAVSVPDHRYRDLLSVYPRVRPRQGIVVADLTVLDDGRLAGRCTDGSVLAVGAARLGRMLGDPAAVGRDVALLATVTGRQLDGLCRYLRHAAPSRTVHLAAPGAEIVVADDLPRVVGVDGRPGTWVRVGDDPAPRWESRDGWLIPAAGAAAAPPADPPVDWPAEQQLDWPAGPVLGPRLESAARGDRSHALTWLPDRPQVNADPFTLYVAAGGDPAAGVASPRLFLVGRLDPGELAGEVRDGWLLQVEVGRHGAVDVPASDAVAPGSTSLAAARLGAFVLPAGWLDRCRAVSALRVSGGELIGAEPVPHEPVRIRCLGAGHGIAGLPEESAVWPAPLRRYRRCYALLPVGTGPPPGLALLPRPPAPDREHRLATLRVRSGDALDVASTAARLADLPAVRADAGRLLDAGTRLLLPRRAYRATQVVALADARGAHWQLRPHGAGRSVAAYLARAVRDRHEDLAA
ncbi:hypothetical protein ABT369_25600 [Dactylosporangium sp. NPDC000244]|uniref:hypothetical protein n=1 Tax=Dactylosporangium sp. NPDC000244 TaxID=3154365 RepID=UPI0033301FCC